MTLSYRYLVEHPIKADKTLIKNALHDSIRNHGATFEKWQRRRDLNPPPVARPTAFRVRDPSASWVLLRALRRSP